MAILVVDDAADNRHLLRALLRRGGHTDTVVADSAESALVELRVDSPSEEPSPIDLILMDLQMPGLNGIDACRRIKADPRLADIPIIMVTACTEVERLEESFDAGAIDYIHKPVNRIELLARVRAVLALKSEMDRRKERERELLQARGELEAANRELRRLAVQDALTAIPNRRVYEERIDLEWRRGTRERTELSLVMIDVDHFKQFNDNCGHQAGDECLKAVAQALAASGRRPGDLVARYGGEEFVALLPRTDSTGARHVAESMRRAVAELGIPHPASSAAEHVTISLGCATVSPRLEWGRDLLVRAADQALYRAKECGRNRARAADLSSAEALERFRCSIEAVDA